MSTENVFLALSKYNSPRDENYLTESFVFLLNALLNRDRAQCFKFLNQLFTNGGDFIFSEDEIISITTQEVTDQGTPDIKIFTPDKLIYVEVKHDSPLGYQQIERYKRALDSSTAEIKEVVLLTRFPVKFKKEDAVPYRHVRWYEIYNWFDKCMEEDPVCAYLIESFKSFLECRPSAIMGHK